MIGGLKFPGDTEPDNWDFVHLATVIGVASQTADMPSRRGVCGGSVSFTFNTAVLALTINLLAGLF